MKKSLLATTFMLCFLATVSAQTLKNIERFNLQTREYKEKLDSVVSNEYRRVLQYDERLNLTSCAMYYYDKGWELFEVDEYGYDAQNRLISLTYKYYYDLNDQREKYQYNENGLLSEKTIESFEDGQWNYHQKRIYNYNDQGKLLLTTDCYYWEDVWFPEQKAEYHYTDGLLDVIYVYSQQFDDQTPVWEVSSRYRYLYNERGLCTSMLEEEWWSINGVYDWVLYEKDEYEYDEHDNHTSITWNYYSYDDNWEVETFSYKSEFVFDDHHNCISIDEYLYDETQWALEEHGDFTYDMSEEAKNIAGFEQYWDDETIVITNKLTKSSWVDDHEARTNNFYYSKCTGVGEQNEKQLLCWPNPVQGTLNIRNEDVQHIEIFNMEGKQMLIIYKPTETVDVSSLTKGGYLLKATLNNGNVSTQKFIKQ